MESIVIPIRFCLQVLTFAFVIAIPLMCAAQDDSISSASGQAASVETGVAIVELFTSQGCSSCPPADAVLRQIAAVAKRDNQAVYVLSFHVDYWNRLGWTDPYSDAEYSLRQRIYASAMDSLRVYTPQMIVNGTTEFVGSDKLKARAAIARSLNQAAASTVDFSVASDKGDGRVLLKYEVSGLQPDDDLNIALVDTPSANEVARGENAGLSLTHVNVVRYFRMLHLDEPTGDHELRISQDVNRANASVIAYVQNSKTLRITGATIKKLP